MRPVNLIPPEERRGEHAPLRTGILSYAIVGVLALALAGVAALVLTGNTISEKEAERASLEAQQLAAEQRAQELAPYGEFASMAQSRRETISSLADSRFDWDRVLHELALVLPEDVWLDSLNGSVAAGVATGESGTGATAAPTDPSITGPSLQISGCADGQVAVAGFVAALKDIDGVTRVGMQQSSLGDAADGAAAAAPAEGSAATGDCQTRDFIAAFEITVAFDAVPAPPAAASSSTIPATAATTTAPATTTDDGETADVAAAQEAADASAAEQSAEATRASEAVGAG